MPTRTSFGRATWGVDAVLIWGSGAWSLLTFIGALWDGWGVAISLILAAAIIPLAMIAIIALSRRRLLREWIARTLTTGGTETDGPSDILQSHIAGVNKKLEQIQTDLDALSRAADMTAKAIRGIVVERLLELPQYNELLEKGRELAEQAREGQSRGDWQDDCDEWQNDCRRFIGLLPERDKNLADFDDYSTIDGTQLENQVSDTEKYRDHHQKRMARIIKMQADRVENIIRRFRGLAWNSYFWYAKDGLVYPNDVTPHSL